MQPSGAAQPGTFGDTDAGGLMGAGKVRISVIHHPTSDTGWMSSGPLQTAWQLLSFIVAGIQRWLSQHGRRTLQAHTSPTCADIVQKDAVNPRECESGDGGRKEKRVPGDSPQFLTPRGFPHTAIRTPQGHSS